VTAKRTGKRKELRIGQAQFEAWVCRVGPSQDGGWQNGFSVLGETAGSRQTDGKGVPLSKGAREEDRIREEGKL